MSPIPSIFIALFEKVLASLLKGCLLVKAVRACVQWAEEMNFGWASAARNAAMRKSGHGCWTMRLKDGKPLESRQAQEIEFAKVSTAS